MFTHAYRSAKRKTRSSFIRSVLHLDGTDCQFPYIAAALQPRPRLRRHVVHHRLQIPAAPANTFSCRSAPVPVSSMRLMYPIASRLPNSSTTSSTNSQILANQLPLRHLLLLAEIDQLAIQPVPHRAKLVLHQQRPRILPKIQVALMQLATASPPSPGSAPQSQSSPPRAAEYRTPAPRPC